MASKPFEITESNNKSNSGILFSKIKSIEFEYIS